MCASPSAAASSEPHSLADVTQQHIGALHFGKRSAVSACDGLLDQAFLQPDAQIASHDLDQVLGLERRGAREQLPHERGLRRRTSCGGNRRKAASASIHAQRLHVSPKADPAESMSRRIAAPSAERRFCHRSHIPELPISGSQFRLALPESSATTATRACPPTCSVVSSQAGNGFPERNTAETDASSTVRDVKYSATIPTFTSFLVVPAIASQASANFLICRLVFGRPSDGASLSPVGRVTQRRGARLDHSTARLTLYTITYRALVSQSYRPVIPLLFATSPPEVSSNNHEFLAQDVAVSGGPAAPAGTRER